MQRAAAYARGGAHARRCDARARKENSARCRRKRAFCRAATRYADGARGEQTCSGAVRARSAALFLIYFAFSFMLFVTPRRRFYAFSFDGYASREALMRAALRDADSADAAAL